MAFADLKKDIYNIVTAANTKTRKDLSLNKVETYVYHDKYIKEYCKFVQRYLGVDVKYTKEMTAAFYLELQKTFMTSNEPFHIIASPAVMRVTKVDRATASREAGGREKTATNRAKKAAIELLQRKAKMSVLGGEDDPINKGKAGTPQRKLLESLHGHHGGPKASSPKTTLGMEAVRENMPRSSAKIGDLVDALNQRTPEETLRDVVVATFNDVIDTEMKLSSLPHSVMATRNVRTPNPTTKRYSLDKAIQIKFALGSGSNAQGQAYTDALKDWDAGKKGKLSDKIDSILAQVERKITDFIIKQMVSGTYDLTMMKSSPSVVENVLAETPKEIVRQMFPHRSKPDMRLKVNKRLFANMATPKKGESKFEKGRKTRKAPKKTKRQSLGAMQVGALKTDAAAASNPMTLRNLLNEILPQAVAQNMVAPRLRYRTGRLANSVRVDNITQGPRGGNTMIETSYRNDPYETFAPGGKKYTSQRDPEKLIRKSVRQVATGLIGPRFGIEVN